MKPLLAALALAASGLAGAAPSDTCLPGSAEQARSMVLKAVAHLQKAGPEKAFRDFQNPDGAYVSGDLYIFVVNFDGNMLVNAAFPQALGANALGAEDRRGRPYIRQMLELAAKKGEGWVRYDWVSPCTGDIMEKNTFFKRSGDFVIAVGTYGSMKE